MKAVIAVCALLLMLAACATGDGSMPDPQSSQSDARIKYGGSHRVRGGTSSGVYR